jgi:hypothetical protein
MASAVDICNLALSHVGHKANVASIDPPEASVEAQLCAQFYPIARNRALEMFDWSFARVRTSPAALANTNLTWAFCYARPADAVRVLRVLPPESTDDSFEQPFIEEALGDGTRVLFTNMEDPVVVYTRLVVDPAKFSPLFVTSMGLVLGSYLAGPLIKGREGRAVGKDLMQAAVGEMSLAKASNANAAHGHPYATRRPGLIGQLAPKIPDARVLR